MENWDKGIKMFDEAVPVDQELLDKMDRLAEYFRHRGEHVTVLSTSRRLNTPFTKALRLVKDPETGAYRLPDD
jgi:uncharacterized protein YcbK (DUF882 family)